MIDSADSNRVLVLGSLHEAAFIFVSDYARFLIDKSACVIDKGVDGDQLIIAVHELAVEGTKEAARRKFFESYLRNRIYVPNGMPLLLSELAKDINVKISEIWPSEAKYRPYLVSVREDASLEGTAAEVVFRGTFGDVFACLARTRGVLYYDGNSLVVSAILPDLP